MIIQFLHFAFRQESTEEQRNRALKLIRDISAVESVSFAVHGRFIGDPAAGYSHAYSFGLADLDAVERYMYDPVHLAHDPEILPHLAKLHVGIAASDDPDPNLFTKITQIYQGKVARHPEWERLMASIPEVRIG
ncbi:Dabb family protein [Amycolatopsis sp. lyj-90]|uniref:Dabb family protein n=1 Tax=Amycolatopsis sp. lyj-90 TaxID=2789285 RepID=UPI00397C05BB